MNNIKVNEEKLKAGFACFNTDDLLYTMRRDIEWLESHNKNYNNTQYNKIDTLKFIIGCFEEVKDNE